MAAEGENTTVIFEAKVRKGMCIDPLYERQQDM